MMIDYKLRGQSEIKKYLASKVQGTATTNKSKENVTYKDLKDPECVTANVVGGIQRVFAHERVKCVNRG